MGDLAEASDPGKLQRSRLGTAGIERNAIAENDRNDELVEPIERIAIDERLLQPAATDEPNILLRSGAEMIDQGIDAGRPGFGIGRQIANRMRGDDDQAFPPVWP